MTENRLTAYYRAAREQAAATHAAHRARELADGLAAYTRWRITAPEHLFTDGAQPVREADARARAPHLYVHAVRDSTSRPTGRWAWAVYDADAQLVADATTTTWLAARAQGLDALEAVLHHRATSR